MQIILNSENVVFTPKFQKSFKKLDYHSQLFVSEKLQDLLDGRAVQDIRMLKNYPYAEYRLKIGDFRVLFDFDQSAQKYLFIICKPRKVLY